MSKTFKHQESFSRARTPRKEKGTKTTMRVRMMRELENEDYQ